MPSHQDTLSGRLSRQMRRRADELAPPAPKHGVDLRSYRYNIAGFARDVCAIWPSKNQLRVFEAVEHFTRVSVSSGHKIGKSNTLAIVALWFYCTFPEARVVLTASTDNQVNGILWREIRRMLARAKRKGIEIPGVAHELARSGIVNPVDLAEIKGYTARDAEAIAGVSGPAILYLIDEASGVKDHIFQAVQGNRAGGNAWTILTSNPTRADGEFYNSHHAKTAEKLGADFGYHAFAIDSRESPNCTGEWREMKEYDFDAGAWRLRTKMIPGIAEPHWVEEMLREHGEDSPIFGMRVAGKFQIAEQAKIFPIQLLVEAQERYTADETPSRGRLYIGCDPAGDGEGGDESKFAPRRGQKVFRLRGRAGMSPADHLATILDICDELYEPGFGLPVVNIESEGEAGWKVYKFLRECPEALEGPKQRFSLRRIRTSDKAVRQPHIYDRVRDELAGNLREWLRAGGALPPDVRLEAELHAYEFQPPSDSRAALKITPKKDLRKLLGRSPDSADAVMLSAWEAAEWSAPVARPAQPPDIQGAMIDMPAFDPWAALDPWRSHNG